MKSLALIAGLVISTIGAVGVLAPDVLVMIGRYSISPIALYAVAALRVGIGLVLLRVAPASRSPRALRVLGAIILVGGLVTALLGVDRWRAILDWWSAQGPAAMRLAAAVALAFGGFLVYAVGGSGEPRPRGGDR